MDQKTIEKLALALNDDNISHDLDECLRLLTEHRKNRYSGLQYESKNDGQGGLTVTIHFPSASEAAKYEAMANANAPAEEGIAEPAMASSQNVTVRVAEDLRTPAKSDDEILSEKYPRKYLESLGIKE